VEHLSTPAVDEHHRVRLANLFWDQILDVHLAGQNRVITHLLMFRTDPEEALIRELQGRLTRPHSSDRRLFSTSLSIHSKIGCKTSRLFWRSMAFPVFVPCVLTADAGETAALTADEPLVMVHCELPTLLPDRPMTPEHSRANCRVVAFTRALHLAEGRTTVTWPFTIGFRSPGVPEQRASSSGRYGVSCSVYQFCKTTQPNCPATNAFLVSNLKFLAKIFVL